MQIWTTPYLNSLLSIAELPVRLISDAEVKNVVLDRAEPEDIAIIALDDGYESFLTAARERGIFGPLLFISPEPVMIEPGLRQGNFLVLDLKKMGAAAVGNVVHTILSTARYYHLSGAPSLSLDGPPPGGGEEKLIAGSDAILERLGYVIEKEVPVIAAIEVREHGEPVIARGICAMKKFGNEDLVLHRFRQAPLLRGMRAGKTVTLYFTYREKNHGAVVTILKAADQEIHTTVPERMFITREIRIQPNKNKPVTLYMHIPHEPTTSLGVLDISPRGLGFLCSRELTVGHTYGLTIMLPAPATIVLTCGTIKFKREDARGFRYGAEIQPHPWDQERIARYVLNRETELISLLRNDTP